MNELNTDFEKLKMKSNEVENVPPPPPPLPSPSPASSLAEQPSSILTNTSDLIDVVNNVYIHMEVKSSFKKQNSSDSSKETDDSFQSSEYFKLFVSNMQDSDDHILNKENFIQLLRSFKAYLDANTKRQIVNLKSQNSLEEDDDAMDTDSRFEYSNSNSNQCVNNKKEILYGIKSLIRKNKFKTESDQDLENAFDDENNELVDEDNDENDESNDILPRNLIVTSIPLQVFTDFELKLKFENFFTSIDARCNFCYFRLFKRCCIQYEDSISAVLARFELDNLVFLNERLKIFLTKVIKTMQQPFRAFRFFSKLSIILPPSAPL